MRIGRIAAGAVAGLAVIAAAGIAVAWKPALPPIDPPAAPSFAPELVRRGATLAALGDCNTCHTETGTKGAPGRVMAP